MRPSSQLLALAVGLTVGAQPAGACAAGYQTYFSHSRLQLHDGAVNLRVRVTGISGRVVMAELDGPFARLSNDGNVRILLPREPANFACEELGPTEGNVFVSGIPVRGRSGTLTLEAVPSLAVRIPRVRSSPGHSRYDQYIVDPAYRSDAPTQATTPAPPR